MAWADVPESFQLLISSQLTTKQLDILKLHLAGCGTRRISTMLGISRSTVRSHLFAAQARLATQSIYPDGNGGYYIHEPGFAAQR